jgi:hypothetical protein
MTEDDDAFSELASRTLDAGRDLVVRHDEVIFQFTDLFGYCLGHLLYSCRLDAN